MAAHSATRQIPEISVLVPVYNCEDYLAQTLSSLRDQTFSDFEVIVCDDHSDDSSLSIAAHFAQQDERFKVKSHSKNVGMTANWNRALSYAAGRYVMKLDADDAYAPATLLELHSVISNSDVFAALCRTVECDSNLTELNPYRGEQALTDANIDPTLNLTLPAIDWYQHAFADRQIWHSNAFILRTESLRNMHGWDEQFGCASDTDLILRILEQDVEIAHVAYPGVLYRMREGSVSDEFRKNDALIDENYVVALRSLQRSWQAKRPLNYKTKLNWYRLWQNARNRAQNVRPLPQDVLTLPLSIKLVGMAQRAAHRIKTVVN